MCRASSHYPTWDLRRAHVHVVVLDDRLVLGLLTRLRTDIVDRVDARRVLPDVVEPNDVLRERSGVDVDRFDAILVASPDEVDDMLCRLPQLGLFPALNVDDLEAGIVEVSEEFIRTRVESVVDDLNATRVSRRRSLEGGDAPIDEIVFALANDVPDAVRNMCRVREVELHQEVLGLAEIESFGTDEHGVVSGMGM